TVLVTGKSSLGDPRKLFQLGLAETRVHACFAQSLAEMPSVVLAHETAPPTTRLGPKDRLARNGSTRVPRAGTRPKGGTAGPEPAVPVMRGRGTAAVLLDLDARAGGLEDLLGLVGCLLGDAFEDRLGGVVHE